MLSTQRVQLAQGALVTAAPRRVLLPSGGAHVVCDHSAGHIGVCAARGKCVVASGGVPAVFLRWGCRWPNRWVAPLRGSIPKWTFDEFARMMTSPSGFYSAVRRFAASRRYWSPNSGSIAVDGSRTFRVGRLDVAGAGEPVWFVVGPVDQDAGSRAGNVLDRMAALGPRYRVGLQPSQHTQRWNFDDKPSRRIKPDFDVSGCATAQDILNRVTGRPVTAPISVVQAGEYLCIGFDHGVGDSNLMMEVVAALSSTNQFPTGFVDPVPAPTIDMPVRWATVRYVKWAPCQVIRHGVALARQAWSAARTRAAGSAGVARPAVERVTETNGYRALFLKSEPHFADELRAWREATHTHISVSGMVMLSICHALRDDGLKLADECDVVVDLRRFLPDAAQTLSNFFTVTRVHAGAGTSYSEFGAELHAKANSIGLLVKLAGHSAAAQVFAAFRGRGRSWRLSPGKTEISEIRLTISDLSQTKPAAKINWTRPMDAEVACVLPPPGNASQISILLWAAVNGSYQITATMPSSLVDAKGLRSALCRALTTENLAAALPRSRDGQNGAA